MLTLAQATAYLDETLGISVPSFVLQAAVDDVATREAAMTTAGYSASTIVRIQAMAVAVLAGADFARKIKSQAAPSGASRSFENVDDALSRLRRALSALDTANTVADLLGPDPKTGTLLLVTC
jgi:uncharacterized protein YdaL